MNIQKKQEEKPQQKTTVAVSSYNKSAFDINLLAIIPVGKFKGRTVEYVMANEAWYWKWVLENELQGKWNLIKLKKSTVIVNKPKWDQLYSETYNRILVGIRMCPVDIPEEQYNKQLPY